MDRVVAIDFGSTYTKGVLFDCAAPGIVAVAYAPSTVATDVTLGLRDVLAELRDRSGVDVRRVPALACSSAAGGLRVAVIGLVPVLSLEAAQRAALGAGARIVGAYGYKLTPRTLAELVQSRPDIVLLAGGTDGGDEENILHNAAVLAGSPLTAPVIVAGNQCVLQECVTLLQAAGKTVLSARNLLPEIDRIDAAPVHDIIRDLFISRITHAKGIDRAREHLDLAADIIPTPSAVLEAARLVADGTDDAAGLGDTLVVDVGGATTDVYSIASGAPSRPGVVARGLPELRLKRTVEGDLGMRVNAPSIVERCGGADLLELAVTAGHPAPVAAADMSAYAARISERTDHLPASDAERAFDDALGRVAVRTAMRRHAGVLREVYTPAGLVLVQEGKDLGGVAAVVGVGGVLAHGRNARFVLEGALDPRNDPYSVLPTKPALYVDSRYVLYGVGLLSAVSPKAAFAIAREALIPL
jgi:uncharacterized protein (TIGR01319 family)